MSFEIGSATNYQDLLNKLNTFLTTNGKAFGLSFTGTGNGAMTSRNGGTSSIAETFTITATSATTFSVVGSISGNIGTATVGTTFTHAKLTFLISAGGITFVAGDVFKLNTCPPWTNKRNVPGSEMIWMAPGNDGLRQIYVGALAFTDAGADYFNWRLGAFNGYASGQSFITQPGFLGTPCPVVPLWNNTIPYWFVANGQRVIVVAKISANYMSAYLGNINTYIDPGYWPYPVFVGGSMAWYTEPASNSANWRHSYSGDAMHAFWRGYPNYSNADTYCSGRLRLPTGTFIGFQGYIAANVVANGGPASLWPYACDHVTLRGFLDTRENLDGSYPLFPIVPSSDSGATPGQTVNTWGELDGIRAVTGHANSSENTVTEGVFTYVVFQNTCHTEKDQFCAVQLD
jgi:hypothetical protein